LKTPVSEIILAFLKRKTKLKVFFTNVKYQKILKNRQ